MDINFESVVLKNACNSYEDTFTNECKTDIDSNSIAKILGIYVKTVNSSGMITDKKTEYKATVIYSLCYIDTEGNIKRYECNNEISGVINGVEKEGGFVKVGFTLQKVESDVSSIKLLLKSIYKVNAKIIDAEKTDYVVSGEDLILKNCEIEYYKSFGKRISTYPIDEEFTVDYAIKNVLSHKITPIITSVQCGVGCIIVDGEVQISALLLQNGEKSNIIRENKSIPYRAEIEYEEAMPSMIAIAEVVEKSFKTDIAVDENENKSTITANIVLSFEGEAFAKNNAICPSDCFSLTRELDIDVNVCELIKPLEQKSEKAKLTGDTQKIDLTPNSTLLACYFDNVEIAETKVINGKLNVLGVVSFGAIFKGEEGEIYLRKLESDFSHDIEVIENDDVKYNVLASVLTFEGKLVNDSALHCEYQINFQVNGFESQKIKVLVNVKDVGEKCENTSSISVYIPFENEELWSLAKRLNTPPEEICEINKDLQFPLSGKERIVVYRQKR